MPIPCVVVYIEDDDPRRPGRREEIMSTTTTDTRHAAPLDSPLYAWLGGTELTDDELDRFTRAADRINLRFRDEDDEGQSAMHAMTTALQVILGETDLRSAGQAYIDARGEAERTRTALVGALIASAPGTTEVELAKLAGVSRVTVRKALGK